jgi:hypothetical protein
VPALKVREDKPKTHTSSFNISIRKSTYGMENQKKLEQIHIASNEWRNGYTPNSQINNKETSMNIPRTPRERERDVFKHTDREI